MTGNVIPPHFTNASTYPVTSFNQYPVTYVTKTPIASTGYTSVLPKSRSIIYSGNLFAGTGLQNNVQPIPFQKGIYVPYGPRFKEI